MSSEAAGHAEGMSRRGHGGAEGGAAAGRASAVPAGRGLRRERPRRVEDRGVRGTSAHGFRARGP